MNIEPRKRFRESAAWVKSHQDLVVSPQFRAAIEAALGQMMVDTAGENPAANWYRMEGAITFARILLNLAENPKIPPTVKTPNLDHAV